MLDLLVKSGVKIAQATQVMSAAPCPASLARLLDLKQGNPIFRIERLVRDDLNRPIQHLIVTFRWDSFSYRVSSTSSRNGRVVEIASAGRMEFPTMRSNDPPLR
jgi:GntR family transcriptional regulator